MDPEKHQLYSPSYGQFKKKAAELLVGEAGGVGDQVPGGEAQQIQDRVCLLSHLLRILPAPQVRLTRSRTGAHVNRKENANSFLLFVSFFMYRRRFLRTFHVAVDF